MSLGRSIICSLNCSASILRVRWLKFVHKGISWLLVFLRCLWGVCCCFLLRCVHRIMGMTNHDDVIKWKQFPRYWPFVRGIHRSPVNSPHKGQWRGALMLSMIPAWIYGWVNNREAGDLRRHHAYYDVIVMFLAHHLKANIALIEFEHYPGSLLHFCC